jgi:hypothetical protein
MANQSAEEIFPMKPLWKYLSVSETVAPPWQQGLVQLAVEGRAFFPSPKMFNDPFDCLPHFPVPSDQDGLAAGSPLFVERMVKALTEMPADYIRGKMAAALNSVDPSHFRLVVIDSLRRTSANMGVFCLSETIDSVLMWSHYASHHAGIALRFEMLREPRGGLMPVFKVQYERQRPTVGLFSGDDLSDDITAALATKAAFWEYEQEWRCFRMNEANTFVSFNPSVITGVAFGATCSEETQAEVRRLLGGRQIDYFRATATLETFDINLVPL